ncbi:MAG: glycosyltransferase family 4 protein [Muribaculum sp.]|nr:glycosyltransferase family 4 protein [Muribaculum sp.]
MKILWVNPGFLDYRVPLYQNINDLTGGEFYIIYGASRMPKRVCEKVKRSLNNNAIPIDSNYLIRFGKNRSAKEGHSQSLGFANDSIEILIPKGLYGKISNVKADIIIAEGFFKYTPWALLYSLLHRKPLYIYYERTLHTERKAPWWRKAYRKFISRFAEGFLVNGQETKKLLETWGISSSKIHTGGMCADSEGLKAKIKELGELDIINFRNSLSAVNDSIGLIYIYVGQLIERKGVDELLSAWVEHIELHPNDTLILVGGGVQKDALIKEYNDPSIVFVGEIDYNTIYKYYASCDVFIIPTLEDNWSLVVPEAMACGLPIACSIYNGCHSDLVHEGQNGTNFDPLSHTDIIRALAFFHGQDLRKMGGISEKIEEKYNPKNAALAIIDGISYK